MIRVIGLKTVPADYFSSTPAGESATLFTTDLVIHRELASLIPQPTSILPVISKNLRRSDTWQHVYHVTTRGYTIDEFVAIVSRFHKEDFNEAYRAIERLRPREESSY